MSEQLLNYNEFTPQVQGLDRQRKMAEMLMTQGTQQPQGQMVSGHYVAPSWAQNLAGLANIWAGKSIQDEADKKQQELAKALQGLRTGEQQAILEKVNSGDTKGALSLASISQYGAGKEFVPALIGSVIPKKTEQQSNYETYKSDGGKLTFTDWVDRNENQRLDMERRRLKLDEQRLGLEAANQNKPQIIEGANGTYYAVNPRNPNQAIPVTLDGKPLLGNKGALTESQGQATGFGIRAKEANSILTSLENQGVTNTGLLRSGVGNVVGSTPFIGQNLKGMTDPLLNKFSSDQQQMTDQARKNFVTAILRKESGASISPSEFSTEESKYFPVIGDSAKTIAQKQRAREIAIQSLVTQAGGGARQIEEFKPTQINSNLSPQDKDALDWANRNPNDPRAKEIRQRLGVR